MHSNWFLISSLLSISLSVVVKISARRLREAIGAERKLKVILDEYTYPIKREDDAPEERLLAMMPFTPFMKEAQLRMVSTLCDSLEDLRRCSITCATIGVLAFSAVKEVAA